MTDSPPARKTRSVGLVLDGAYEVGRDPRSMTPAEFSALGHRKVPPVKALRNRCLDCCCGQLGEVRKCVAVDCPAWPFRMGVKPRHGRSGED